MPKWIDQRKGNTMYISTGLIFAIFVAFFVFKFIGDFDDACARGKRDDHERQAKLLDPKFIEAAAKEQEERLRCERLRRERRAFWDGAS